MRLITWNCGGGYRNKIDKILDLQPDIAIIQECESLESIRAINKEKVPEKSFRFSERDHNKGVTIFFHTDYEILSIEYYSRIEFVVPIRIRSSFDFYLFAVWAMQGQGEGCAYTGQVERAVNKFYPDIVKNNPCIFIGDFNSPRIYKPIDKPNIEYSLVKLFENFGISSAYHEHYQEEFGSHTHPTFYQHKKKDMPSMLDYCFASREIISRTKTVEIGRYEDWNEYSDHCPLIIEIEEED